MSAQGLGHQSRLRKMRLRERDEIVATVKTPALDCCYGGDALLTVTHRSTTSQRCRLVSLSLPMLGGLLTMVALALPAFAGPRVILKGHPLALGGLAYSADGMHVATASYDRT